MTDPIINKGPAIGGPINGQTVSSHLEKLIVPVIPSVELFFIREQSFATAEYVWSPFGAFWNYKK